MKDYWGNPPDTIQPVVDPGTTSQDHNAPIWMRLSSFDCRNVSTPSSSISEEALIEYKAKCAKAHKDAQARKEAEREARREKAATKRKQEAIEREAYYLIKKAKIQAEKLEGEVTERRKRKVDALKQKLRAQKSRRVLFGGWEPPEGYYTAAEAGRLIKTSSVFLRRYCMSGELAYIKHGKYLLVRLADCIALRKAKFAVRYKRSDEQIRKMVDASLAERARRKKKEAT